MSRHPVRIVVLTLTLLPLLLADASRVAAQDASTTPDVVGSTYTSPTFGYTLTWDDSWYVVRDATQQGQDELALSNGSGITNVVGERGFLGYPKPCVAARARAIGRDPAFTNVAPLLDDAGKPVKGGDATRAYAAFTLTQQATATNSFSGDLVASLECRTLVPGQAVLEIISYALVDLFPSQAPLVQTLLTGLVLPSPGERGPVFVAGPWRVAVAAAARDAALPAAGLKAKAGKDWLLVVADVTDWSPADATLAVTGFGIRLDGGAKPRGLAAASTAAVARKLDLAPTDVASGVDFAAGQTQRLTLVFQIPHANTGPALTLTGEALPLADALAVASKLDRLPPVVAPPWLRRATVTKVVGGGVLQATLNGDASGAWTVALIGVGPSLGASCFAAEATARLKKLAGKTIWLEQDPNGTDADVLPRYVWIERSDGTRTLVNQQLLAGGDYVLHEVVPVPRFGAWLEEATRAAQAGHLGRWGACAGRGAQATPGPAGGATPTALASPAAASGTGAPAAAEVAYLTKLPLQPAGTLKMSLDLYDTLMQNPQPGDNLWLNRLAFVFQYWAVVKTDTEKQSPPPARYAALGAAYLAAIAPLVAAEQQMTTVEDYLSGKSDRIDMSGLDLDALATAVAQARGGFDQYNRLLAAARAEAELPSLVAGQAT